MRGIKSILQDKDTGVIIKNGTKEATAIETIMFDRECNDETNICGKEDTLKIGDYNQTNINTVAANVASWLKTNGYTSVQDAINRCTDKAKLDALFAKFEDTYEWTENVKYRRGSYADADSGYGGKIVGTAIVEDNDIITSWGNDSKYYMSLKETDGTTKARMSMLSDYAGNDMLILDYNAAGYSFLFDVEIDKDGNLLNYSRDLYVKFKGEEANNTGLQICNGRETRHAIETVQMKPLAEGSNTTIFTYNQDTIDAVRQNVADWLATTDYMSVQDVLHSGSNEDVNAMMLQFAGINS